MCLKAVDVKEIDNANGESDNATINTLGTQGCTLVTDNQEEFHHGHWKF